MKEATGNIWDLADSHWLVIPTNGGWDSSGRNVMGRGLAIQAAKRYPDLARQYGHLLQDAAHRIPDEGYVTRSPFLTFTKSADVPGLLMFVTKPLRVEAPHLSWQGKADLDTIKISCHCLATWLKEHPVGKNALAALPLVGCGEGGLQESAVLPVLNEFFGDSDRIVLVRQGPKEETR